MKKMMFAGLLLVVGGCSQNKQVETVPQRGEIQYTTEQLPQTSAQTFSMGSAKNLSGMSLYDAFIRWREQHPNAPTDDFFQN